MIFKWSHCPGSWTILNSAAAHTVHCFPCLGHFKLESTLYSLHYTAYTIQSAVTAYTTQPSLCSLHYTACTIQRNFTAGSFEELLCQKVLQNLLFPLFRILGPPDIAMDGACSNRPWLRKRINVTASGGTCSNQRAFRQLHTGRKSVFLNTRHCTLKLILCMREWGDKCGPVLRREC